MKSQLRYNREARGLSLRQLASATGISKDVIARIETGTRTPNQDQARTLWRYFEGEIPLERIYDPFFNPNQEDTPNAYTELHHGDR